VTNRNRTKPKLSAVGQKIPIDMSLERLILVSFKKKRSKKQVPGTWGCQLPVIKPLHRGSSTILSVTFFGTLCLSIKDCLCFYGI